MAALGNGDWRKQLIQHEAVYAALYPGATDQKGTQLQPEEMQQNAKRIPLIVLGQFQPQNKSDFAFRP
jgi:hypothetical protein